MPSLGQRHPGPQQLGQAVAPVLLVRLDGEIHQERQVLLGAKPDQLTGRGEEGGLSQAAQVAAWGHRGSIQGVLREYAVEATERQHEATASVAPHSSLFLLACAERTTLDQNATGCAV
jgi:hypothetical protein